MSSAVKIAAAARQLLRLGDLSEGALNKLRAAKILPSPARYAAGLERGNQNLIKEYGMLDLTRNMPRYFPTRSTRYLNSSGTAHEPAVLERPMGVKKFLNTYFRSSRAIKQFGNVPGNELSALVRRHEINEGRARSTRDLARLIRDPEFLKNRLTGGPHASPDIVRQEGRDAAGLSPSIQRVMRELRSLPHYRLSDRSFRRTEMEDLKKIYPEGGLGIYNSPFVPQIPDYIGYRNKGTRPVWPDNFYPNKQAAAARNLMRMGNLSEGAIGKLRLAKMLPSPKAYAAGLERGNQNLISRMGLIDETPAGHVPHFLYHRGFEDGNQENIHRISGSLKSAPLLRGMFQGSKDFDSVPGNEVAALFRRHEINEAQNLSQPASASNAYGHASFDVLRQEGRNAAGLSPKLQNLMLNIRGTRYNKLWTPNVPTQIEHLQKAYPEGGLGIYNRPSNPMFPKTASYGIKQSVRNTRDIIIARLLADKPLVKLAAMKRADFGDMAMGAANAASYFIPGVGTARMGYDAFKDFGQGRWLSGLANVAGAGLSLIPGGSEITGAAKFLGRGAKMLGATEKAMPMAAKAYRGAIRAGEGYSALTRKIPGVSGLQDWGKANPGKTFLGGLGANHALNKGQSMLDENAAFAENQVDQGTSLMSNMANMGRMGMNMAGMGGGFESDPRYMNPIN